MQTFICALCVYSDLDPHPRGRGGAGAVQNNNEGTTSFEEKINPDKDGDQR